MACGWLVMNAKSGRAGGLAVTVVLTLAVVACGNGGPVVVEREEPSIARRIVEPEAARAGNLRDMNAETQWDFHCVPEFKYEVTADRPGPKGRTVVIQITQVKAKLSLPITIWLPKDASAQLVQHEDGHVKICTDVYARAEDVIREAAKPLLKTVYQGEGKDAESACRVAIDEAGQALGSEYRRGTVDVVNRVSNTYDQFANSSEGTMSSDELVKEAFARRGVDLNIGRNSF